MVIARRLLFLTGVLATLGASPVSRAQQSALPATGRC
jgi:hypothetical protein